MSEKDINLQDQVKDIVDITELINPFPGLRPFGIEEGHLFFGREGQSDEVLVKLAENKFAAILGSSGSGKSSFMYCGLVPSLNGGFMTQAGSNWRVVVARPGGGPIDNLAEALLIKDKQYSKLSEEDKLIKKTIIGTVLRSSSLGLVEVIRQLRTENDQNVLVVIDQFEELFRFRKLEAAISDMDESSAFVNLLLEAVHQFEEPIFVTITMRSDFIGECAKFPDLTQMINDSHYLIPQMTRDQKRTAIEGPVAVGGGKIAPRLTQQLLNDVGDNPDQLPILQHALMRTWAFWVDNRKVGEAMDLRHYNAIGTLREALSQHANEAYDSLSKREKEICEVMFKSLTERGSENQGIRRPTKLGTIAAIAGVTEDEVTHVVDKFREPGRSLLMPPYGVRLESETVIDISHESLMRIWDRLKRWLDEESKAAEMYLKLSEAAERFQAGKASLWKMPDLQLALNWREENKPTLVWGQRYNPAFERTMVFLETSEKAYITEQRNKEILQKRQIKRMRIFAVVLGLAAMICIFLVVFSQIQLGYAEKEKQKAEAQEKLAAENATKAEANAQAATEAAAQAELEKNRAEIEKENAQKAQQDALAQKAAADKQRILAEAATEEARKAQAEAAANAIKAQEEAENAKKQQAIAEDATRNAERLRFQSIAQSMAIKATKIEGDNELKALVAKQAYQYYQEYKDPAKEYNGDVYAGVYYGLEGLLSTHTTGASNGDSVLNQYHGHLPVEDNFGRKQLTAVRSVSYSADGKRVYSAGSDGRLLVWDMTDNQRTFKEVFANGNLNRVVNVSPDERYVALGTDDNHILVIDLKNKDMAPKQIEGHMGGTVFDLEFFPDGKGFISTGVDSRILLHTLIDTRQIATIPSRAKCLAISPDGNLVAAGTETGDLYLIDITNQGVAPKILFRSMDKDRNGVPVDAIDFSHDGKYLAFGDDDGKLVVWDLENKVKKASLTGFLSSISEVHFSPNDKLLAGSSKDGTVRMWDLDNIYDLPTVFDDHKKNWVWSFSFDPSGNRFITGAADGILRMFETTPDAYAARICPLVKGNLSRTEWRQFVGDIDYRETCEGLPERSEAQ